MIGGKHRTMNDIEKTVFICYRRTNFSWALAIFQDLTAHGYDVFFDYYSIESGDFEQIIVENIKARAHFIVILTPSALERCVKPNDWVRKEIEIALENKRNIVPVMFEGFDYGSAFIEQCLTGKLQFLKNYNALRVSEEYFPEAMSRLREKYLNISIDAVLHPVSDLVAQKTLRQQVSAVEEPKVRQDELNAQKWFEIGIITTNPNEKIKCFREAIKLNPELPMAYNNLGCALDDLGRYEEAEEAYYHAIDVNPSSYIAYTNLGILLNKQAHFQEAKDAYLKAIEINPKDDNAFYSLGNIQSEQDQLAEAQDSYMQAIEINPIIAQYYIGLGNVLDKQKKFIEAEFAYRLGIKSNPDYGLSYYNLGKLLNDQNRFDEAEKMYEMSIRMNPNDLDAYLNLGMLYLTQDRYNESEKIFLQALDRDPNYSRAHVGLGTLFIIQNRVDKARNHLMKSIHIDPTVSPFLGLACICKRLNDGKNMRRYLEEASDRIGENGWYDLACLESIKGNLDTAFGYLAKAQENGKINTAWAWKDPDLEWLRKEDRFGEIICQRKRDDQEYIFGVENSDAIYRSLLVDRNLPPNLTTAGIALVLALGLDVKTVHKFFYRYCKEICEHKDEIYNYIQSFQDDYYLDIIESATNISKLALSVFIDDCISRFPKICQDASRIYKEISQMEY